MTQITISFTDRTRSSEINSSPCENTSPTNMAAGILKFMRLW